MTYPDAASDAACPRRDSTPDRGRSAVYAAQDQLARLWDRAPGVITIAGSSLTLPVERRFGDLTSVQTYTDKVLALGWVRSEWPLARPTVTVRARRGTRQAHYEYATATMAIPVMGREATWALRELVILHELAHHLGNTPPPDTGHGADFQQRFMALLAGVIGPEAGFIFRVLLADQGGSQ